MRISQGKTARQIRRREILVRMSQIIDNVTSGLTNQEIEASKAEFRILCLELAEICAIEANTQQKPRIRK